MFRSSADMISFSKDYFTMILSNIEHNSLLALAGTN